MRVGKRVGILLGGGNEQPMTHLRQRRREPEPVTYVSIGVRGKDAARIVAEARTHARIRGVTFGSLVMEALAAYVKTWGYLTRAASLETEDRG